MGKRPRAAWNRLPRRAKLVVPLAVALIAAAIAVPVVLASGGESGPCAGGKAEDYACWEEYFGSVVQEQGGDAALVELAAQRDVNPYVLSNCHTLAHGVGRAALAFYGTINEASKYGDGTCWSGYFHGMYEQYMKRFDDQELLTAIPTICERPPDDPYAFDYYNCLHGIGHGVTIRFDNDPFPALKYCDAFGEDWERTNCHTGVFMQNIVVDRQLHQSVRLNPDDPVYPCNAVDEKYKKACYLTQTSYILRVHDYDYEKGFEVCDGIEADYVSTCYISMGRDISGNSHREAEKVLERCSLGDPEFQEWCYVGAARNAVFHDHGRANADALCAIVAARYRESCESQVQSAVDSL
jgi:hypothetical protein